MGDPAYDDLPPAQELPIAVRAYAAPPPKEERPEPEDGGAERDILGPSPHWVLVFDTETTVDATQQLRFGTYQVRRDGELHEEGVFYDPLTLSDAERSTLYAYARHKGLQVHEVAGFVEEVFFHYVYDLSALCVGFNLPFDLSRIAIAQETAKSKVMRGGFSFLLSPNKWRPRLQVKHLNSRAALIQFTKPPKQDTPRSQRAHGIRVKPHRGYFVDVRTLAGAILSGSWSLASVARHLNTEHKKLETEEHGAALTAEYLKYATQDALLTWECFDALRRRYEGYGLAETPVHKVFSEAGVGKAYLRQMGITPWTELQSDFPPEELGIIMSTYYGGRAEVHLRRVASRVMYDDFLSMYPTVCTLMKLWPFVMATGIEWEDATSEVREFLNGVTAESMLDQQAWQRLRVLVRVKPEGDIFPVRADYAGEGQYSIGLNYLTSDEPLWFTLADCIASKVLTGKPPKMLQALRFHPEDAQEGLQPINIAGNPDYRIDPAHDDFYRRLIDLRAKVRDGYRKAKKDENYTLAAQLDAEQLALKITANATSYGIFVELNVAELPRLQKATWYGIKGKPSEIYVRNREEPGRYFHPLLATLITGAARLMLAIAENLATNGGLGWAFCDTDSMALAQPEGMDDEEFVASTAKVQQSFNPLNPYEETQDVFKVEDANFRVGSERIPDNLEALFCWAVSAKRYALFNERDGTPMLRKASAHGLGHLLPPYGDNEAPVDIPKPPIPLSDLRIDRWQYDLWYRIVEAALRGHPDQVNLRDIAGLDKPAVSRYGATTPTLLRWFKTYNKGKAYRDQVKPFNFMLAFQAKLVPATLSLTERGEGISEGEGLDLPHVVAPFHTDPAVAVQHCFDRQTGKPVSAKRLKTYREAVAQYHLHPEAKFGNADWTDRGMTTRRRVKAIVPEHIGKEANRWEEQFYTGDNPEAQVGYGVTPEDAGRLLGPVLEMCTRFGQRAVARASGVSLREASAVVRGQWKPKRAILAKLYQAMPLLEAEEREREERQRAVLEAVRESVREIGLREFARLAGVNASHLAEVLAGKRGLGPMQERIAPLLERRDRR